MQMASLGEHPPESQIQEKFQCILVTTVTNRAANTNSWAKQTLKYLPSSIEVQLSFFFFTVCILPLQFFPLLVKGTFYEVKYWSKT